MHRRFVALPMDVAGPSGRCKSFRGGSCHCRGRCVTAKAAGVDVNSIVQQQHGIESDIDLALGSLHRTRCDLGLSQTLKTGTGRCPLKHCSLLPSNTPLFPSQDFL